MLYIIFRRYLKVWNGELLYYKPEDTLVSIGYIPRCRSLRYFHNRGPNARGCINRVETEPRYITDLYHMGYVALT